MRNRPNFNHLECFFVLARTQSFSKAAEELKIAQPAVSKQIKLLEEDLGVQLFVRTRKAVLLTEAGKDLHDRTASLYGSICQQMMEMQSQGTELTGQLRIGLLGEVGERVFLSPISEFKRLHPDVTIHIMFLKGHEIIEKIKVGELDLGITPEKVIQENIRSYEIFKEEIILVSNKHNARTKFNGLGGLPFVAYRENDPLLHYYLQKTTPKMSQSKLNIQMTVNSHRSMSRLLQDHPYYAVLPRLSVEEDLKDKKLVQVGQKSIESKLYLIVRDLNISDRKIEELRGHLSRHLQGRR